MKNFVNQYAYLFIKFIIAVATVTFIAGGILYYFFHFADRPNFTDASIRPFFIRNEITKKILNLNGYGDGRFEYLSSDTDTILVETDYQTGLAPQAEYEIWVKNAVKELTGKEVETKIFQDKKVPDLKEFTDSQIEKVFKDTQTYSPKKNQKYIHVLILSKYSNAPSKSGIAFAADKIVIFNGVIEEVQDQESRVKLQEAALRIQLGKLIGFDMVTSKNCVMIPEFDSLSNPASYKTETISLNYCAENLVQLDDFKKML